MFDHVSQLITYRNDLQQENFTFWPFLSDLIKKYPENENWYLTENMEKYNIITI